MASFALCTPMTAASATSGWVRSILSSSAGGTVGGDRYFNQWKTGKQRTLKTLVKEKSQNA